MRRGLLLLAFALLTCTNGRADTLRAVGLRKAEVLETAETVYDGALAAGWSDWGWAPRELGKGPARLDFSSYGGWIVARSAAPPAFGALTFRYRAPRAWGEFLEVRVESTQKNVYPHVVIGPEHRLDLPGDWVEVVVPVRTLDPERLSFDRVVFWARTGAAKGRIELDKIAFTKPTAADAPKPLPPATDVELSIDCAGKRRAINPLIYGIAYDPRLDASHKQQWLLGASARRWGGNASSRYNWELGNAWNTASDWFFENVDYTGNPKFSFRTFLQANADAKVGTALTVPILGWVAKDTAAVGFPVSIHGAQRSVDPFRPTAGDGWKQNGKPIAPGPPQQTSVAAPPEMIGRWIAAIRADDVKRGRRSVQQYILDNEPMLWNSTHRDVHPDPVTYDELLDRLIRYGSAVRKADPGGTIAGPALWGWPAYLFSAKDAVAGFKLKPDRLAHGDVPLLPWLLRKLHEHEQKTGTRVLDVVDVHFYPQAARVGGQDGGIDAETAALRVRSTRALWDPTYVDESWIKEPVMLIPRLETWIAESAPGLGISIGEWNFGAEQHGSSGAAVAETLGRFGAMGVSSAFYWTYPAEGSAAFHAFRAFRGFDGAGGRFLDLSIPAHGTPDVSVFASRDAAGTHVVAIVINLRGDRQVRGKVKLDGCTAISSARGFRYAGAASGFAPMPLPINDCLVTTGDLPPWGIAVVDLHVQVKE